MADEPSRILETQDFALAVTQIQRRAERQIDAQKLEDVFVQSDLFTRAKTTDSQLILGRRGTGKTHLMKAFERAYQLQGQVVYYFDCTRLGSGYSGLALDAAQLAPKYFVSLLNELGSQLLDAAARMELPDRDRELRVYSSIIDGLGARLKPRTAETEPTFNYRQIAETLEKILDGLDIDRLYLVLDEWAQIPVAVQPFVAEYLKRSILSVPRLSLKILAVSYQCEFLTDDGTIGLERGADITDVLDIDVYLTYDEKAEFVISFFAQVLYNHLGSELGWDLSLMPARKMDRLLDLFTQRPAFVELVRSAEGNCRDLLCIFSRAYFEGFRQRGGASAISIPHVRSAAGSWFENEKHANIREERAALKMLEHIVNNVVSGYKSRTFMVESGKSKDHDLTRLLNERLLHSIPGYYSHPDRPGVRYEIMTIDYGAYVRFRGTVNEPFESVLMDTAKLSELTDNESKYMVPLDDRRSIRRIIFDPEVLTTEA